MAALDWRGSVRHSLFVAAIGVFVLAACSTSGPPSAIQDAVGDLSAPGSVEPVTSPDYVDIRTLAATIDGNTLNVTVTLAGALPAPPPLTIESLRWVVALRTGTDGEAVPERHSLRAGSDGYGIILGNQGAGEYCAWLVTMPASDLIGGGAEFPGTVVIDGDTISWTVPLAVLGNPGVIRAGVWAQRGGPGPRGGTIAWDLLPDDDASGSAAGWLTLWR